MQIPLKWINELVDIQTVELDTLIEKLTLGGFEVEEIIEIEINNEKQIALDISSTANRSDSLSIQGISMEIATLLNKPVKVSNYCISTNILKKRFDDFIGNIPDNYNCSVFLAITINNLKDTTIPKWLTEKLISSGLTPLNNLLDFQNYILLETGYPFAFYDADKISSKLNNSEFQLSISTATTNQEFNAGNGISYKLNNSTLLITADKIPISIAGIIEDQDFSYSENTKSLLIEGSIFNAATIRQQSRILGLRTERSARYEKSLKNSYLIESLYRLIHLLRIYNPTLTCKLQTINKAEEQILKPILLRYEVVNEILGPIKNSTENDTNYLIPQTISSYLERLNFSFKANEKELTWEVTIPSSRTDDLTREIDLIEEIGRLHGFNNFLTTLPKIESIGTEDLSYKTRKKITSCLLNLGLSEFIHYSLVPEKTFVENNIKLVNPLLSDCSNLRTSLLPSLIQTVQDNLKQGNNFTEGFEYGHVFSYDSETKFKEKEYIAGIFGGMKTKLTWSDSENALTWFEAKGKIEQFFKQVNLLVYWQSLSNSYASTILHPYRKAEVYLSNGVSLGIFGQIHPIVASNLNLSSDIYLFEFDIQLIQDQLIRNKLPIYKEYSLYPRIVKDLSLIVHKDVEFADLKETVYSNGTKFLVEVNLLDEYKGQSIPENYISLCLQLIFQSTEKTLQNKYIEAILDKLQLVLNQKFKTTIRQ